METTGKSILGLVDIYNMLPQEFVDTDDVRTFQARLQGMLKDRVGKTNWETLFSPRHPLHAHPLASLLNGVTTIAAVEGNNGNPACEDVGRAKSDSDTDGDKPPAWW